MIGCDGDDDYDDMMSPMMRTSDDGDDGAMNEINDGDDAVAVASWMMNYALSNHYCSYHYMEHARVV